MKGPITALLRKIQNSTARSRTADSLESLPGDTRITFPNFADWRTDAQRRGITPASEPQVYIEDLTNALKKRPGPTVQLSDDIKNDAIPHFQSADDFGLQIYGGMRDPIKFEGKQIRWLEIHGPASLELSGCTIRRLVFGSSNLEKVILQNCRIGCLRTRSGVHLQRFEISRSIIRGFEFEQASGFLEGPVTLTDVALPTIQPQIQALRTLRAELLRIHNTGAAGVVHAAELRLERERQGFLEELISWLYDIASAYGTSTMRPFLWFWILTSLNIAFLCGLNATRVGARELIGWQSVLEYNEWATLYRAMAVTYGQSFNPLGTFGTAPLIVITKPWIAAWSTFFCALATSSLALFVLAVRRRFRLET